VESQNALARRPISTAERPPETGPARLILLEGPQAGRKFKVGEKAVIGRRADADVVVDDPGVSRSHARITRTTLGTFEIEDLGSKNGTLVNGVRVDCHALTFGDKIQVGPRVMLVFTPYDPVEDQILQRQQLEGLGRMGAGIAHDLNNMLGAVAASVDYLSKLSGSRTLSEVEVRECLVDIQLAATQAADLTRAILRYARGRPSRHTVVNLSALCVEVVRLVRHTFDRAIQIEAQIQPNLMVHGDQTELHQVLMNLCLNARDAMPDGGILRIASSLEPMGLQGKQQVSITVQDDGTGMDDATRSRIFEPFFTTKREGAGFGIGLATVKDVVTFHGGRIMLDSSPGKGTLFQIYLPATNERPNRVSPTMRFESPSITIQLEPQRRSVLLVDDEEIVRRSISRLLRQAGHAVTEASSGRQAVEMYKEASRKPEVVVLDLDMPEMSGEQTHHLLLQQDPLLKIIFVSGHDDSRGEAAGHFSNVISFLRKPCNVEALLAAVERALVGQKLFDEEMTLVK
jgi:two-component system cell cycle sensor histidine kinase/response regulator CckA